MLRNITALLTLTLGLILTLTGQPATGEDLIAYRETKHSLQQTYTVKYSDVFTERAAEIAQYIEKYRQEAVQKARAAQNRGDRYEAQRIADEARNHLSSVLANAKKVCPPTNVTVYGIAERWDLRHAKQLLRAGTTPPGKPLHIYILDGRLITSYAVPKTYDMPNGSKSGTPVDNVATGRGGAANPRTQTSQTQDQGQQQGPGFGGLNRSNSRTLPSGTTGGGQGAGGTGIFGL